MTTASIVTHCTRPEELRRAIGCILRCSEVSCVYVVDNSPTEALRPVVESISSTLYIHVPNDGFGAGHNVAIRQAIDAGADYHLVMNADVMWDGDVLSPMLAYMDANPDVGVVAPKVYYPDGDLQYACRMLPTPWDLFAKRFLPASMTRRRMNRYLLAAADHDRAFNCPYLLGSFMLFRVAALRDVGLFDERFFMYPEDIDITRRIHERWRTMFWPGVSIVHVHAASSRTNLRMLRIHLVNMFRYFNKWGWWYDRQRRRFNRELLRALPRLTGPGPSARG
ncbi:MAG: glycosyltransferase family 2 protein [Muribaculaceae bacterium]|nr:glycosyltransferase family 2 protein [Muribaculaceae bacterium]